MFDTVLVANRGEIAVRVVRTLRRLGIRSVAVYSDADAGARHVREADVAVRLGPAAARESYLSVERVVAAAVATGAQAVHPGYGFLSENPSLAAACADAGIVFVGPPVDAIAVMGDKIRAKQTVSAAGVPVVPGRSEPGLTDADLLEASAEVGFPVMLKPSAGGGGKGMRVAAGIDELREAIPGARREAAAAFGDDTLFLERYVARPRHIEVQVLADAHGQVVHLGERECSLQRRHQKVVEEAPSPLLSAEQRARMGAAAVEVARAVDYRGAGTVEFLVSGDAPDEFFFLEMNTRLQVEHPVTELVTGLDLVEQQLRIAAGERLDVAVRMDGWAVEARVYAEDPARGFLPTGGPVLALREPTGQHVRVDSGLRAGSAVTSDYDPMLAKVVAWGPDRVTALARLDRALAAHVVLGVPTNTAFLRGLLTHPDVVAGRLDTQLVERVPLPPTEVPREVLAAYAVLARQELVGAGPWDAATAWRPGGPAWTTWRLALPDGSHTAVSLRGSQVRIGDGEPFAARAEGDLVTVEGSARRWLRAVDGHTTWLGSDLGTWALAEEQLVVRPASGGAADATVRSPMPGTVLAVHAAPGEDVSGGSPLVVVEAMKMEHVLRAPYDGRVAEVRVRVGDAVAVDQVLCVVEESS